MDQPAELESKTWDEVYAQREEKRPATIKKLLIVPPPRRSKRARRGPQGDDQEGDNGADPRQGAEAESEEEEEDFAADDPRARRRMIRDANDVSDFERQSLGGARSSVHRKKKDVNVLWTAYETEKFRDALRIFGSDFTLMESRFGNRSRNSLKAKFGKEDDEQLTWLMRNSFPLPDDLDPFTLPFPSQLRGWDEDTINDYHQNLLERLEKRYPGRQADDEN